MNDFTPKFFVIEDFIFEVSIIYDSRTKKSLVFLNGRHCRNEIDYYIYEKDGKIILLWLNQNYPCLLKEHILNE